MTFFLPQAFLARIKLMCAVVQRYTTFLHGRVSRCWVTGTRPNRAWKGARHIRVVNRNVGENDVSPEVWSSFLEQMRHYHSVDF